MNTTQQQSPSLLGKLLLTRLTAGGKPPAKGDLVKAVTPFFSAEFRQSEKLWKELVLKTLAELANAGLTTHPKTSIRITESGQQIVCDFLELEQLPEKRPTWSVFKRRHLFPRAVGTAPAGKLEQKRAETSDGVKAAVLASLFNLKINPYPTMTQAIRALIAQQGIVVSEVNQTQLCDGMIQKWLTDVRTESVTASSDAAPARDLHQFAERVRRIVLELRGDSPVERVLISDVWQRFEHSTDSPHRHRFDKQLILADEQDLLSLSRADLPGALPPEKREASAIETPTGQIVHFVRG